MRGPAGTLRHPAETTRCTAGETGRRTLLSRFGGSSRGVAALEFALVAPFLITLFLGATELAHYLNTLRKLTYLSNSVAQMLAQSTSGTVNDDDLHFAIDSTMVLFPDVLKDSFRKNIYWWQDIDVAMSTVAFTPTVAGCTSGCTYTAQTAWASGGHARPCNVPLGSVADTAAPSPLTLPSDVFTSGALVVVDVVYNYTPVIAPRLFGTMTIRRSAYIQPRYVPIIKYNGWGGMAVACPGY